jgi:two-component system phosphate regulon sensor histidine kinase PhoR
VPFSRNLVARLVTPYLLALLVAAAVVYAYSGRVMRQMRLDTLLEDLLRQAHIVGAALPWDVDGEALDQRCVALVKDSDTRVTVIALDGRVLGDSAVPSVTLENHGERPEVRAAMRDGQGQSMRPSHSVGHDLFYVAWRQPPPPGTSSAARVIRLAVPSALVVGARHHLALATVGGVFFAALAGLLPALVLNRRLSDRVTRLADFSTAVSFGQTPPPLQPQGNDALTRLETNVSAMATGLQTQLELAREEKRKLEAVLGGMVEGVLVIDRSATIRLSNQRAERLFGLTVPGQLVGLPLLAVSRDPELQGLVRDLIGGTAPSPLIREISLEGSSPAALQVTATPIGDTGVSATQFILVFHDITALKRLEVMRRDFVANVSHELRTPLTAISGYAETLQAGAMKDPELASKFLGVIARHCDRLQRLIDDLLTLSDLELGRTELQRASVALGPAVDAAIDVLQDKAARGQVAIRAELPPQLPSLDADPDRLEQVLVNLIDNAVKYTPAGGTVTISAQPPGAAPAERFVEVCVADTGIGIPKRDIPRLTERFYRVDKARSRELGGTGLGLAIVKYIVQAHGGSLHIDSDVGHGTRVYVRFPAA